MKQNKLKLQFQFKLHSIRMPVVMRRDFVSLRDECLRNGELFCDPNFKPSSKLFEFTRDYSEIKWMRPKEILSNPKFVADGYSREDVIQGGLGNCWFLAGLAALAENEELRCQVIPDDNDFGENYAGIFHFR
jgi:hypothetical protein